MLVSIVIDLSRSRVLRRAALKHHSQALEADALHFSTDVWSSSVVLAGLLGVWVAGSAGLPWLAKADAVAALGVSAIVVFVSFKLGRKTITDLLDGVPAHLRESVVRASHVPGVLEVRAARVRRSGPELFVDVVLIVSRHEAFEHAHDIADQAKAAIRQALDHPDADVMVHVAPNRDEERDILAAIRSLAARHGLAAHDIRLRDTEDRPVVDLHLEIMDARTVAQAHDRASGFEEALREAIPGLGRVFTHLEPVAGGPAPAAEAPEEEQAEIRRIVADLASAMGVVCDPHDIRIEDDEVELAVSFHCTIDAATDLADAHRFTERFEQGLRAGVPRLGRVLIHIEPPETDPSAP
jgi:divalent metal cation (Fe/Co/Zn/Cd) transporter